MEEIAHSLKEISFNSNSKLRDKIFGPPNDKSSDKENEDVFNKIWSCYRTGSDRQDEHEMSHNLTRVEEGDESLNCDHCYNSRFSVSAHKNMRHDHSLWSATYETNNSIQYVAPCFGNDDPPGRDTLLFKCREAIESLQEEIEDHQKAINERDYLLAQSQEREEQLVKSKKSAINEIHSLREKLEKIREEMKENEEHYEKECHKMIEENKKLQLENIELESKVNKYHLKLESMEETISDLKLKKSNLENSNEKLESKIKDLKCTLTEYETANQQLDTKLMWAEKTYEEGINKMVSEYERKEQMIQKQNQELLDRTQNERLEREAKIKAEMKEKIMGIQKGIEASNEEIKRLRDDKQKLLEENMKLTQMLSDVRTAEEASHKNKPQSCKCHNCNSEAISKYLGSDVEFELKQKTKENQELSSKNKKLEKHLDGLKAQVNELKNELVELKAKKKVRKYLIFYLLIVSSFT